MGRARRFGNTDRRDATARTDERRIDGGHVDDDLNGHELRSGTELARLRSEDLYVRELDLHADADDVDVRRNGHELRNGAELARLRSEDLHVGELDLLPDADDVHDRFEWWMLGSDEAYHESLVQQWRMDATGDRCMLGSNASLSNLLV